jgi:two-component system, LytTR family, response regulator
MRAIQKVKSDMSKNQNLLQAQLQKLERFLKLHSNGKEKISVTTADRIIFINISEIIYCEAKGAYTRIYLHDGKNILTSKPLGDFESQLSKRNFFRIHHSFLINLDRVKEFQRDQGMQVLMEKNIKLAVSQRKRKDLLEAIEEFVL